MKSLITTLVLLFICFTGFGQSSDYAKLDSLFTILTEEDRFFGSVAVSRAGEIIYTNAIGSADLEANIANSSETKFRVGSISKSFTAVLVMKAVEIGKIKLDDNIESYFPGIENGNKITIRHLLNHRSGIYNFTDRQFVKWYTSPITKTALVDTIISKGVDFQPDTDYAYSNSNYVLLTFVLEDIFNQPFPKLLEEHITKPLGLMNTSYGGKIVAKNNEAKSYNMKSEWTIEPEGDMSIPQGAGAIISTPTDLCHFARALFNGELVSKESLEQMHPVGDADYGFAIYKMPFDDKKGIGHGGNIDAFSSTMTYFKDNDIAFAISCNGSNYGMHDVATAVLSEVFDTPYDLPSFEFVVLSSEELDLYLGTYETDELPMDFIITKADADLILTVTGQSGSPLAAEGNHKFSAMQYGVKIEFFPADKEMRFEQSGHTFDLTLKSLPERVVEIISTDLDQYLGVYESDILPMDLTISRDGDRLMGQGDGQPSFPLDVEGNHTFTNKEIGLKVTFDPAQKKMNFVQGGVSYAMTIKETTKPVDIASIDLDQYLGTYKSDVLPIDLTISRDGEVLMGQGEGQRSFKLKLEGDHNYSNETIGLSITFEPKKEKLNFIQGGSVFEMTLDK